MAVTTSLSPPTLAGILALAFIVGPSTHFAFGVWNALLIRYPLSSVAPYALLVPVFGILSGELVLGEPFNILAALGSTVCLPGFSSMYTETGCLHG